MGTSAMRRVIAAFFILGLGFIIGCGSGSSSGGGTPSTPVVPITVAITGQVVGVPEMGITFPNGATVTIIGHPEFTTQTDTDGNFRIEGVPQGAYTLSVRAIDSNGEEITDFITVNVGGNEVQLGSFTIVETGAIMGIVQLEGSANLLGTLVYIPGTSFSAYTDDDGYFIIVYIPQGTYRLHFQRNWYAPDDITGIVVSMADVTDVGTLTLLTDGDGDEIADSADNCPLVSNFDQLNTDGDLYGNVCDDDDDNDGWTDAQEAIEGTDPLNTDTDDDLINDPADNCPLTSNTDQLDTDTDGDGNACDDDDDNDGLTDIQEAAVGTDPLDTDTDDDGLIDSVDPAPLIPGTPPYWTSQPTDINARTGLCDGGIQFDIDPFNEGVEISFLTCQSYQQTNGIAADSDLPNTNPGDTGFLSCGAANNTCSFPITVTGSGAGEVSCQIEFATGPIPETCNVDVVVTDGKGLSISKTIEIKSIEYQGAWYVDADATGEGNGSSWLNAFTVLQDAIDVAVSGEAIWVAEGTYTRRSGSASTDSVLVMKGGVEVYGGFIGTETNLSQRGNPADHPTILDGENSSYHVVIGASNSRLDGLTITGGNANGSGWDGYGAGLYNNTLTNISIAKCIVINNNASNIGGGAFNNNSSISITNSTFSGNSSATAGGGAYYYNTTGTISKCLFIGNSYPGTSTSGGGGGIAMNNSPILITGCTFTLNTSGYSGGGMYIVGESAASHSSIINSIIKNNTASLAAGILIWQAYSNFFNCNIVSNTATGSRGGGGFWNDGPGYPTITNSIIWGNTSTYSGSPYPGVKNQAGTITATYNDSQSTLTGTGNINLDPRFVSATDFHLLSNSPCINAGTSVGASSGDFDGNPRPSPTGGKFDMGAYEFPITASIDCSNPGPNPVNELSPMQCAIISNYYTPIVDTVTDTCGGTITGAGPRMYNFTPSESRGPGTCVASVKFAAGIIRSESVTVLEVISPPVDHAPAAVTGRVYYFTFFNINPTDPDIPAQALTCMIESATGECVNGVINGCAWSWTPTPAQGPTECDVVTKVYDGVEYSAAVTTHVTINGIDQSPSVIVDCLDNINEDESTACSLTATDPDIPPQALTCSKNAATTCTGVLVNGCTDVFVPAQGEVAGPGLCMVVVDVADDFVPPAVGQGGDTINILEVNNTPHWSTAPSNLYVTFSQSYDRISGYALDEDMPNASSGDNGFILCSAANNTCSFLVDIYGSGAGAADCRINFSSGPGVEVCSVDVIATDGNGLNVSKNISINVNSFLGIWLVDADATGAGNGTSWADAFTNVQDAVNQAVSGEMVWVAEGNYKRPGGSPTTQSVLVMKSGVSIYGGFAGTEIALSNRGNPANRPTILDGQNTSHHVVLGAPSALLDGFTVTKGQGDTGTTWVGGGGMRNDQVSNLTISNCIFKDNLSGRNGAGMFNLDSSNILVSNCSFINNVISASTSYGGGLSDHNSSTALRNCVFKNNHANYGGAFANAYHHGTVTNCVFIGNTASRGGAYDNYQSDSLILNCTFSGNSATSYGGGIYLRTVDSSSYPIPTITNCIFWGDTAPTGDEIYKGSYLTSTTLPIQYSDVQGGYTGTNIINADPLFVSATDFHLQRFSPCVDTGTSAGAPSFDFDGYPRPIPADGEFDMGAYEYFPNVIAFDCDIPGPNPVNELSSMQCSITAVYAPLIDPTTDTCHGSISASSPWTYNFTPSEAQGPGSCVASLLSESGHINETINIIEVNTPPTDHAPASVIGAVDYLTSYNIAPTDPDIPAQALTCEIVSAGGECVNGVLNGCLWSWTPTGAQGPTECDVVTRAFDGIVYSGAVATHVTIKPFNNPPSVIVDCPDSMAEDGSVICALTASDTDVPPQGLTCSKNVAATCTGVQVNGCTSVNVPPQAESAGPGSCSVVINVIDDGLPPASGQGSDTITLLETNTVPHWSPAPSDIYVTFNQSYSRNNGRALDTDLPNTGASDPGHLTCAKTAQTCSFPVTVSSVGGNGNVYCGISFTAGSSFETCSVSVEVSDGWTPALTISDDFNISVSDAVNWEGTSVSGQVGGIRPSVARIQNNYPADFGQITMNFGGAIITCSATVTCASAGNVPVTGTVVNSTDCRLSAVAGYWPSNDTCIITNPVTGPICLGPGCSSSDSFKTSLRLSECAPRGGPCGGFIDDGSYGSGDGIEVDLVDARSGAPVAGAGGAHAYVLLEHPNKSPVVRIEQFDGDNNGAVSITNSKGLESDPVKITAAYKGSVTGTCDNTLAEHPDCYKFATFADVDSRRIIIPMERTTSADWQMPDAQIWGYVPIGDFSRYVGPRPGARSFPLPARAAVATLGVLDQSIAGLDLRDLLRSSGELSTFSMCFNALGINVSGISLPVNMVLPDLIRQQWNATCAGHYKMSPANTTFRIFTNRPNIIRKVIVIGFSVNTKEFNVYKGFTFTNLPVTMTALGTATLDVPAIPAGINMGDSGGTWLPGTSVPKSVPFEFDFRDSTNGGGGTGKGRQVQLNLANPPFDQERVRMGLATDPDFGDPNRQRAAEHQGQFYTLGDQALQLNLRAGSNGLIPFQLVTAPMLDDSQFTIFQKQNIYNKTFSDQRPWRNSSTNSLVVSSLLRGLPSTTSDTDISWADAEPELVGILMRSRVENVDDRLAATSPISYGNTRFALKTDKLETYPVGQVFAGSAWLPLPEVTDPGHNGYYVPAQSNSRGWPINRNGQIIRGTAQNPANAINKLADGARYFSLRNPLTTAAPSRYADLYILELVDSKHIANNYSDPVRGTPDNRLWKIYGAIGGQASQTFTLPFIMPRHATLDGVNGIVPDPFEAGNMTNQIMEWSLTEQIFDTGARGINQAFNYQNLNIVWTYEKTYFSATDAHQFYWK